MATSDTVKDVALNLKIAATGGEQVKVIADALLSLAQQGGAAAPEILALSENLRALGQQSGALQTFRALDEQVALTTDALKVQQGAVSELKTAYDSQQASTTLLADAQKLTSDAVNTTKKTINDLLGDLAKLKTGQTDLTVGSEAYKVELLRLNQELANQRILQRDQKQGNDAAKQSLNESNAALAEAAKAYTTASREASTFERTLANQRTALDEAKVAMAQTGVGASTLSEAEGKVAQSLEETRVKVATLISAEEQLRSIREAVGAANERAVKQAQAAADARVAATERVAAEERVLQQIQETRALAEKLAIDQEMSQRAKWAAYIGTLNDKAVAQAKAAAAARVEAEQKAAAAEELGAKRAADAFKTLSIVLQRVGDDERKAGEAAQALADKLQDAFSRTGTKAVQDLREEVVLVRQAMEFLRTSGELTGKELGAAFNDGNLKIKQLELQIRTATGELTLMDRAVGLMKGTFGQFTAGFVLLQVMQSLGQQFLAANNAAEQLSRGLKYIYKDANVAASQIAFLNTTAKTAGIEVASISGEFVKFSAAMQTSGFSLKVTNDLFRGTANEAANLGLSASKVGDILNAFGQIASKGTVQLEELKNQLGDAMPGALKRTADALGITLQDLLKLTSEGKLLATDVLPALAQALGKTSEPATTMAQVFANLKNAVADASKEASDTGGWDTLKTVLLLLSELVSGLGYAFGTAFDGIFTTIRKMATLSAGLMTGNVQGIREALRQISEMEDDYDKRQSARGDRFVKASVRNFAAYQAIVAESGKAEKAIDAVGAAAEKSAPPLAKSGEAATTAGAAHAAAATNIKTNEAAHVAAGTAATGNAGAQAVAGTAVAAAGVQAAGAGNQWIQLTLAYAKSNETLEKQIEVAVIHTETVKREAKAIEERLKLSLDQQVALDGLVEGSRLEADSLAALAVLRKKEIDAVIEERNQKQFLIMKMGDVDGARSKEVKALDEHIAKLQELVEKDKASAISAGLEMQARKLAAETYKDNSGRLDELKAAGDRARASQAELLKQLVKGRIGMEEYSAGVAKVSDVLKLEQDTYNDSRDAIKRETEITVEANKVGDATIQTAIAKQKAIQAVAVASNNEAEATFAAIQIRKLERTQQLDDIRSREKQISQYDDYTKLLRDEYLARGPLLPAQQQELKLRDLNSEAMRQEVFGRLEAIKPIESEIDALRRKYDSEVLSNRAGTETIKVSIEKQQAILAVAKASGDEAAALSASVRIMDLQKTAQLDDIANRQIQVEKYNEYTQKLRDEYEAYGPLLPAQEQELKLRDLNVAAMDREISKRKDAIKVIDAERDALNKKNSVSDKTVGPAGANYSSLSGGFDARNKSELSTIQGATYDKQGFATDSGGQRITAGTQLKPPDASGKWEFVSDQSVTSSRFGPNYVPKVGYWRSTGGGGGVGTGVGAATDTAATDTAVTDPYATLGLTSPTALAAASTQASTAMKAIIRSSASSAVKQQAFFKYAKDVFAANNGKPTPELESFASELGLTVSVESGELKFKTQRGDKVVIGHDDTTTTDTGTTGTGTSTGAGTTATTTGTTATTGTSAGTTDTATGTAAALASFLQVYGGRGNLQDKQAAYTKLYQSLVLAGGVSAARGWLENYASSLGLMLDGSALVTYTNPGSAGGKGSPGGTGGTGTDSVGSGMGGRATPSSYSTTIIIDGARTSINTATLADHRALESLVRNLAGDSARAGA